MTIPFVNIIIVCYNCGSDIVSVLMDLKSGSIPLDQLNICIVDNMSSDDSLELLRAIEGIHVNIIESPRNVGFGAGCNLAMSLLSAPRTLLLNPDVHLNSDSIRNLLQFADDNPEAQIWGGKTVGLDGKEDGKNAWKEPSLLGVLSWSFFLDVLLKKLGTPIPDAYGQKELREIVSVDAVSGCFFLINTSLFKTLGGFDDRFFMYSEEVDLCRRARALGATPKTTDNASIVHVGSKTIASLNKLNFLYYSKLKYAQKHWPAYQFYIARLSILIGSIVRLVIFSCLGIFNKNKRKESSIWWAFVRLQLTWSF